MSEQASRTPLLQETTEASDGGAAGAESRARAGAHHSAHTIRVFLEHRLAMIGVFLIAAIVVFCFIGPMLYPTEQTHSNLLAETLAPGGRHPLGTDAYGFDMLGRLMLGGQSSLEVGLAAAILATLFGSAWGAIAGFFGGVLDAVMMRLVDVFLSVPTLVLFLVLAAIFRPTLWLLIVILASLSWLVPARLVRAETLSLREREYVQALRLFGGGPTRAIVRHIIPNAIGVIVVNATFQVADAILMVAALSFLGLGLPPPAASWGGTLSDGLNYLYDGYWWLVYPAGAAILLTVVAFNFVGDALRDTFDVRMRTQ